MEKPKITKITIGHPIDDSPDISWIGEYTDKIDEWYICRETGDYYHDMEESDYPTRGREYRSFIPYAGGEKPGTKYYKTYGMQNFKLMEQLERGDFCFIGIVANAEVKYPIDGDSWRIETLSSDGIWSIKSNGDSIIQQCEKDELDSLKNHLEHFNIDLSNWDKMVESIEIKD